ncbi:DUF6223 family protein [Streptomyces sp. NPDC058657]|uniref:DUF6223 family protein n=1 Tax=unclassified Streptomyces TaxID=2593676 RepID=UPI00365CE347
MPISVRSVLAGGLVPAVSAMSAVSAQPLAAGALTFSAGRIGAIVAAVLGAVGAVIGGLALARPAGRTGSGRTGSGHTGSGRTGAGRTGSGRTGSGHTGSGRTGFARSGSGRTGRGPRTAFGPRRAVAAGVVGMAIGALVTATSRGAIGTGNGLGGAYVALLLGLLATVLGTLAWSRARREPVG